MPDRPKLHHEIRNEFTRTIAEYFRQYPEKLRSPDLERDLGTLHTLMTNVLRIVDRYGVTANDDDEQ